MPALQAWYASIDMVEEIASLPHPDRSKLYRKRTDKAERRDASKEFATLAHHVEGKPVIKDTHR